MCHRYVHVHSKSTLLQHFLSFALVEQRSEAYLAVVLALAAVGCSHTCRLCRTAGSTRAVRRLAPAPDRWEIAHTRSVGCSAGNPGGTPAQTGHCKHGRLSYWRYLILSFICVCVRVII